MSKTLRFGSIALLLLAATMTAAFNGHIVTQGPLTLKIGDINDVTELDTPRQVEVSLVNKGRSILEVKLRMTDLVDEWYAVGRSETNVKVAPGNEVKAVFRIAAAEGACSALYPVHIYANFRHQDQDMTAHAVQIFKSNFIRSTESAGKPSEMPVNVVPSNGNLSLSRLKTQRVAWRFYDKPLVYMPVGWQGASNESSATLSFGPVSRGATRHSITMHPPWRPGGGTIFIEYFLDLPNVTPIKLLFANAIRDLNENEPASDGVTFRVWAGDEKLFERHTDSKKWVDAEVDLSRFAGTKILLRLESHPGPKRNTVCDASYWGEPVIVAGRVPKTLSGSQKEKFREQARNLVKTGKGQGFLFSLDGDYRAALVPCRQGIINPVLAIGNREKCIVFDGLKIDVLGRRIDDGAYGNSGHVVESWDSDSGSLEVRQPLQLGDDKFDLTMRIWSESSGLRIEVACPKRITDFTIGSADRKAPRVYYGHGYCIEEPKAFRASFGGHNLSTSHVGFDFDEGLSLLVASDNPPDYLEVDPAEKIYSLHTHLDATMTLVPSVDGAFDCARKYRPLYDKKASPGFKQKAGRFVFDIWGGRYAEIAETMKRMVAYDLTDSLLTVHVWQRWGYDYRLPDIYPPQPQLGTIEDMLRISKVCAEHDIPWGLHDNYIDFYPDAADYSYDHICFTEQGEPVKAWINRGRDAQSYRWRPDRIMPFVKRNMKLIKPNLKPTHYFIDVFTSLPCFDFYDKQGNFHSMLETRKSWGEAFAWIRRYLGDNAPMTSEAGHDQLTGYISGSDCQHLQIVSDPKRFCIKIDCKDWERVPWFDAVLHDKFSLHGVGYSGRYEGGRERFDSGIESDDYVSAEILEGHALMIDRRAFGRGAVRKYWLAQDFIRSIASDEIEDVEFVNGAIHRQIISWKSGAKVYVNRGNRDWRVSGKTLPKYGYHAKNGKIESGIERIDGVIVEQSSGLSGLYVNARGFNKDGNNRIRGDGRWNSQRTLIDFGPVVTNGAFRCKRSDGKILVTPLPDINSFTIEVRLNKLPLDDPIKIKSVTAVDEKGEKIRNVQFKGKADTVRFETRSGEFAYLLQ